MLNTYNHAHERLFPGAQVSKPYFTDSSRDYVMTATLHIGCDTEGATIYYTVDGGDPGKGLEGSRKYDAAGKVVVSHIGTHTVKAIGTKEGMQDSDIAVKEFDVQASVFVALKRGFKAHAGRLPGACFAYYSSTVLPFPPLMQL